jgi:hypothetical protein
MPMSGSRAENGFGASQHGVAGPNARHPAGRTTTAGTSGRPHAAMSHIRPPAVASIVPSRTSG